MRSKAALLFALVVKRAGATLWLAIVPDLLRFAEQSTAHMRTVSPAGGAQPVSRQGQADMLAHLLMAPAQAW